MLGCSSFFPIILEHNKVIALEQESEWLLDKWTLA